MYVLLAEILGVFLAEHLVEVFACVCEFVGARHYERVVGYVDDAFEVGHLCLVDDGSYIVAHEEQLGFAVIDDVVNLVGSELVQDRHCYGSVGQSGEECYSPAGAVASAQGYLVAFNYAAAFEHYVQFLYLACHVVILQSGPLKVGQGILVPIGDDALFDKSVKTRYFHYIFIYHCEVFLCLICRGIA